MWRDVANVVNFSLKQYIKKSGELFNIIFFFVISCSLLPFAIGSNADALSELAPAMIWVMALLASLLSLPQILQRDWEDGSLEQLRFSQLSLEWVMLGKYLANWLGCFLPLIFITPLVGLMLGVGEERAARLVAALLSGTPVLSAINLLVAGVTLQVRHAQGIFAILALPLYIPTLIFGVILAQSDMAQSLIMQAEWAMLTGLGLLFIPFSAWVSSILIKNNN